MSGHSAQSGRAELQTARRAQRGLLLAVFGFSAAVNLLMLTAPLYMLQVYDRVLTSRSEPTLVALTLLMVGMFCAMGILDHCRSRTAARAGAGFQAALDLRVFAASLHPGSATASPAGSQAARQDLEAVQRLMTSPALTALFDLPWAPAFLALLFLFHPLCGALALGGALSLLALSLLNGGLTRAQLTAAGAAARREERLVDQIRSEAAALRGLGMMGNALSRWAALRRTRNLALLRAADLGGACAALSRLLRLLLQSVMLGLGALLVLREELTPGTMIAASVLTGRALAPVEGVIGSWEVIARAGEGWRNLTQLLTRAPMARAPMPLPRPRAELRVRDLQILPPGADRPVLRNLSFSLSPGQALGVIGPSAAGKSSLARVITGEWPALSGEITLGGAPLHLFEPETLGRMTGWLPQRPALFDGTIAENIARLDPEAPPEAVLLAAERAGVHEMILQLPQGYDTRVSAGGAPLSGGQIQRIALARALYGDPLLLILDEPNASLDSAGSAALNTALRAARARGCAALVMAHRPAAIQECDLLMVLEGGGCSAFGPRDQVLRAQVRNHTGLLPAAPLAAS